MVVVNVKTKSVLKNIAMIAHLRRIRISPKKLNLVAGLVRGMSAQEALTTLQFTNKKAAAFLYKAIRSAVANAEHNDSVTADKLMVDTIIVNKAGTMRRFLPSARGRALPLSKPFSHVSVSLAVQS